MNDARLAKAASRLHVIQLRGLSQQQVPSPDLAKRTEEEVPKSIKSSCWQARWLSAWREAHSKACKAGQEPDTRIAAERAAVISPQLSPSYWRPENVAPGNGGGTKRACHSDVRGAGNWSAAHVVGVLAGGPAGLEPQRPFADVGAAA